MQARTSFAQVYYVSKHFAFSSCWKKSDFTVDAICFSDACDSALKNTILNSFAA